MDDTAPRWTLEAVWAVARGRPRQALPGPMPAADLALAPETARRLRALAERWAEAGAAERANHQLYITELCEA